MNDVIDGIEDSVQNLRQERRDRSGQDAAEALHRYLSGAVAHLKAAETALAWRRFRDNLPVVFALAVGLCALEIAVARRSGTFPILIAWTAGAGLIAAVLIFAYAMRQRRSAGWQELAERVDLAVDDQNAIATAMDLIAVEERSPIALLAIEDGLKAAEKFGVERPAVSADDAPKRRGRFLVLASLIAIVVAFCIPMRLPARSNPAAPSLALASPPRDLDGQGQAALPASHPNITPPYVNATASTANTASSARQAADRSDTLSKQPGVASSSSLSGAGGKAANGSPSAPSPAAPSPIDSNPHDPNDAAPSSKQMSVASLGSAAADTVQSQGAPTSGTAGGPLASKSQNSTSKQQNNGSGPSSGKLADDPSGSPPGGEPEPGKTTRGKVADSGNKSDDPGIEANGGNGQGNGHSAPKKSRSVAPLMLGSLQPDLLQGVQLPGPDERIKLQVPPQPGNESPSGAAAAPQRQVPESAVDVYDVPPDSRQTVDQYFQQFHQDVARTTTDSN